MLTAACGQPTLEPSSAGADAGYDQCTATKAERFDALAISVVLQSSR
jgi:hypothetical protein